MRQTQQSKPLHNVTLLGVPLDLGAENLGVDIGPDAFRYQGIVRKLQSAGLAVRDDGDVACKRHDDVPVGNPRLRHVNEIVRVSEATAARTESAIANGEKVIVLGGDHSVCLGAMAGASAALGREQLGLIYFDAHGDMNTDTTTLTGNIHGMHLAALLGFGAPALVNAYSEGAKVLTTNLLHIGGSDFDQPELDLAAREKLALFTTFDLLTKGMGALIPLIDNLQRRAEHIWISLDLDAIDATYAPGAGMPNRKGLSYREIAALFQYIGQHCNVVGIDIVEYNPLQDIGRKTAELAIELIAAAFGKTYSWYSHYLEQNKLGS